MAATQKYQLIVEAQARGEEELLRLERALTRVDDVTKKARNTTLEIAGSIAAITAAFKAATASAGAFVSANIATEASMQRTLNTYRALRLAIAAPGGAASVGLAAGTIAGGYALQKIIETTVERARQVQGASFSAASTGSSFQSAYTLQRAGAVTGRDLGFLSGYSAADISAVTLKLRGIEDPILRASEAIRIFGKDGKTALETLDGRLAAATARAADLAEELDGPTRNSLNEFKGFFDNLHPFKQLGDEFDDFTERFKIGVAKIAIDGVNAFKSMAKAAPQNFMVGAEGNAETAGFNPSAPIPSDAAFIRGGRADAAGALSRLATPGANLGGTGLAAAFRAGVGGTEGSIQLRLELIGKERSKLRALLSSDGLADTTFKDIAARLGRIDAEEKALRALLSGIANAEAIKASISDLTLAKSGSDDPLTKVLVERSKFLDGLKKQGASSADITRASDIFRSPLADAFNQRGTGLVSDRFKTRDMRLSAGGELYNANGQGTFTAFNADIAAVNPDTGITAAQDRGYFEANQREREKNLGIAKQVAMFEERRIELLTGPGGEIDAINKIYKLKKAGLEQELEFGGEIFNLTERRLQLEQERTLRILDLQRQRRDEARGLASDFVGSLQSGRPQDFFRQQGGRLINQIGTNALTGTFQRVQSTLGSIGAASGLGGLLKGTLLDPSNATPIDKNTLATERNTAALERANGGGFQVSGPNGFNAMRALGPVGGFLGDLGVFGGASSSNPMVFSAANKSTVTPAPGFIGLGTTEAGAVVPLSGGLSKTARGVGIAGAVAGGAIGAYTQFKAGGAQGALNGTAALAGAAGSILALSGVSGPAAPILAGVALGLQGIAMILGDPKKKRDAAINREISDAYYAENAPMSFSMDRFGRGYDYNKRGDMRGVPVTININALDSRSITDNRESIADAVRMAVYEGHGLNRAMQEAVGVAA